ncbi:hypothetical protein [Roseateles noduli]|uniref:hypothetical protein n=1 Tax=Roseateles noduli TaxID=2052484 RepID=UPI003D65FBC3
MNEAFGGPRQSSGGAAKRPLTATEAFGLGNGGSELSELGEASQKRFWLGQAGPRTLQFEFSLRYELDEHDALLDLAICRLERAGCADTLLGADIKGQLELQFVREAASAEQALVSATDAVKKAFPSARLVKIIPAPDTPTTTC